MLRGVPLSFYLGSWTERPGSRSGWKNRIPALGEEKGCFTNPAGRW